MEVCDAPSLPSTVPSSALFTSCLATSCSADPRASPSIQCFHDPILAPCDLCPCQIHRPMAVPASVESQMQPACACLPNQWTPALLQAPSNTLHLLPALQTGSLLLNAVSPTQVSVRVPQMLTGFSLTAERLQPDHDPGGCGRRVRVHRLCQLAARWTRSCPPTTTLSPS